MKKLRVTFCGFHSCIRSYKQAIALKEAGIQINWVCHQIPPQVSSHPFAPIVLYTLGENDPMKPMDKLTHFDHFRRTIKFIDDYTDIYHAYNEPDWFVEEIKKVTDKPVVFDLHDLVSERDFVVREDEELAFKKADAIVTQGPGYAKLSAEKRPDLQEKGLIDFCYSSVPRILMPELDMPLVMHGAKKMGGIVYEGGVGNTTNGGGEFRYRWWLPFMSELTKRNIPVSIHVSSAGDYSNYAQAGVRVCGMRGYTQLMTELTLYDWGLCGNAVHHPAFDKAWPNKLFEYIAAGLPIMVYDSKEAGEFVEKEGIGIVVRSPEDVVRSLPHAPKFKQNVLRAREKYCMENEVSKLLTIYNKLLKKEV